MGDLILEIGYFFRCKARFGLFFRYMEFEQDILYDTQFGRFVLDGLQQSFRVHGMNEIGL